MDQQKTRQSVLWMGRGRGLALLGALAWFAVGCEGEAPEAGPAEVGAEEVVQSQRVTITPEFHLEGVADLGEGISLQHVCMGLGEIRLEPLGEQSDEVVYVTRSSLFLDFDVARGEVSVVGEPITLPHGGEFMISIRIEPIDPSMDSLQRLEDRSLRIDGLMARFLGDEGGLVATGEPTPLPMQDEGKRDGRVTTPVKWIPWTYSTREVGLVLLNNVQFEGDGEEQRLLIRFDLREWLSDALEPISAAVADTVEAQREEGELAGQGEAFKPVDVTERVNSSLGRGLHSITNDFNAEAQGL
jgi:hypothetical protein